MTFTLIPNQFAPLGGELRYAVAADGTGTIDVQFFDAADGSLLGAKRFAGAATASFDAAPCLRRAIRFVPAAGSTGFHTAEGRSVTARIEVHSETMPDATGTLKAGIREKAAGSAKKPAYGAPTAATPATGVSTAGASSAGATQGEASPAEPGVAGKESAVTGMADMTGTAGAAGTVDMAETAGTADTVGTADMTGTAGAAGAADMAETAGTADMTGTAGTAGMAEMAGTAGAAGTTDMVETAGTVGTVDTVGMAGTVGTETANSEPAETLRSTATAPLRTFVPGQTVPTLPALLTTMPRTRLIAAGESDELTFVTEGPCTVTVTAEAAGAATSKSYRVSAGGFSVFRLDTRDFPGAETLTADAGACGKVVYSVIPATAGACRLAWHSSAGSIEHYTFPIEKSVRIEAAKTQAYGPDGYVTATATTQRRRALVSAYETREVLEALAEAVSSPDVWLVEKGAYTPVDVTTDTVVVHRHGAVNCLEIEIRPKRKTGTAWTWN